MTQSLSPIEAELPLSSNVQELRAITDRASVIEPKPLAPPPVMRSARVKQVMMAGVAAAFLVGVGWYGWDYWTVGRYLVSTDDAYVKADNTTVAPKVSGYLSEVLVDDNEPVKAGKVVARIDDRDYKVALDQAKADVVAADAAVTSKRAQLEVQQAVIAAAKATLEVDTAAQTFAGQENKRYSDLAKTGYGSVQNAQLAQSRDASALATIERDNANLASAQKQLELLKAEIAQAVAASARATAIEHQAELNLGYTTITAPIEGVVGNRTLRPGQFVQAGTQLMSLVPTDNTYVIANFKETQLTNVHSGQSVDIAVDMFPGRVVHGYVDSLAPASGQEFALLPPDNATGNFTKVVQRIPVKIALGAVPAIELRPGMSVIPTIQTKTDPSETPRHIARRSVASLGSTR
jgi:membrane fusion protein, multidrug efflux system